MGTSRVCFEANGGFMGATGGCMRVNGICWGYLKPDKGYWAAKIGQTATVWGLVRAV